ncbi:mediator-associated protein 1 [Quillaja saponaria]|uniref:Mediator-associated protein 1 n=1 Tax=Quillaja saponaria TaxID=32244 RepID=A0AAD7PVI0_QUISA|nr:mediator-associated protein 1 [Quillaja saponaria]
MAPKRASPLDEPPTASSSSSSEEEEEEEISSEEEEEEPAKPSSAVPAVEKKPLPQKPVHATNSQPQFSSSESGSESDSDSESEPQRPISAADENVKPIASKPMQETPKATKPRSKPRSKPSATPDRSAAKRPNESSPQVRNSKRAKKNEVQVAEDSKKSGDETKKLFQRLWSEDDELAVLKGMVEFKVKKGADSSADPNAFHDFIKKSLHVDVSKGQMMDKIRRLKKKFKNNVVKGKNGGDFTKPHEQKAFELSKKIWGGERNNGGVEQAKSNGKGGEKSERR